MGRQKEFRNMHNTAKKSTKKSAKNPKLLTGYHGIKTVEKIVEEEMEFNLKKKKTDKTVRKDLERYPLLAKAVYIRCERAVDDLMARGEDIDVQAADGSTPLMIAVDKGETAIVQKLLEKGANMRLTRKNGMNALMVAISKNDSKTFSLLWDYLDKNDTGLLNQANSEGYTLLTLAVEHGLTEYVKQLSNLRGVMVDRQTSEGKSALMIAAAKGQLSIVENLLHSGSNALLEDRFGATALCIALLKEQAEIVGTFLARLSVEHQSMYVKKRIELLETPRPKNYVEMVKFYKSVLFRVMLHIRRIFQSGLELLKEHQFFFGLMKCAQSHQFDGELLRVAFHLSACVMYNEDPHSQSIAQDIAEQYVEAKGPDFSLRVMLSNRSKEASDVRGAAFLPIHACANCCPGRFWLMENYAQVQYFMEDFRTISMSMNYWVKGQSVKAAVMFQRFEEIMRDILAGSLSLKRISAFSPQARTGENSFSNCSSLNEGRGTTTFVQQGTSLAKTEYLVKHEKKKATGSKTKVKAITFHAKLEPKIANAMYPNENSLLASVKIVAASKKNNLTNYQTGYADALKRNMNTGAPLDKRSLAQSSETFNLTPKDLVKSILMSPKRECRTVKQKDEDENTSQKEPAVVEGDSDQLLSKPDEPSSTSNKRIDDSEFFKRKQERLSVGKKIKNFNNRWFRTSLQYNPTETLEVLANMYYNNVSSNQTSYNLNSQLTEFPKELPTESPQETNIFENASPRKENEASMSNKAFLSEEENIVKAHETSRESKDENVPRLKHDPGERKLVEEEEKKISSVVNCETSVPQCKINRKSGRRSVLELLERARAIAKNSNRKEGISTNICADQCTEIRCEQNNSFAVSRRSYSDVAKTNIELNLSGHASEQRHTAGNVDCLNTNVPEISLVCNQKKTSEDNPQTWLVLKEKCGVSTKDELDIANGSPVDTGCHDSETCFASYILNGKSYSEKLNKGDLQDPRASDVTSQSKSELKNELNVNRKDSGKIQCSDRNDERGEVLIVSKEKLHSNTNEIEKVPSESVDVSKSLEKTHLSSDEGGETDLFGTGDNKKCSKKITQDNEDEKLKNDRFIWQCNGISFLGSGINEKPAIENINPEQNSNATFRDASNSTHKYTKRRPKIIKNVKQSLRLMENIHSPLAVSRGKLQSWPKYLSLYQRLITHGTDANKSQPFFCHLSNNSSNNQDVDQNGVLNDDLQMTNKEASVCASNQKRARSSAGVSIIDETRGSAGISSQNQEITSLVEDVNKLVMLKIFKHHRNISSEKAGKLFPSIPVVSTEIRRKAAREAELSKRRGVHREEKVEILKNGEEVKHQKETVAYGYIPDFIDIESVSKWFDRLRSIRSCLPLSYHLLPRDVDAPTERITFHSILVSEGRVVFSSKLENTLREGTFGTYLGLIDQRGFPVIVRECEFAGRENSIKSLSNKRHLKHKNIAKFYGAVVDPLTTKACFVRELCEFTLPQYLKVAKNFRHHKSMGKHLIIQLLEGIRYLHKMQIIHGFLKPSNVLLTIDSRLKLADCFLLDVSPLIWGVKSTEPSKRPIGTYISNYSWRPTELIAAENELDARENITLASDIQMAGMLIYMILSGGKHAFGYSDAECQMNIKQGCPLLGSAVTDIEARDLIKEMIKGDKSKRPTIRHSMKHPYFWDPETRFQFLIRVGRKTAFYNNKPTREAEDYRKSCIEARDWTFYVPPCLMRYLSKSMGTIYTNDFGDLLRFSIALQDNFESMPSPLKYIITKPSRFVFHFFPSFFMSIYDVMRSNFLSQRQMGLQSFF